MVRVGKIILAVLCTAFLVACGPETKVKVGYRPPFVPVGLEFDSDMHISITSGKEITTPLGTFSVSAEIPVNEDALQLIVTRDIAGERKSDGFDINTDGPVTMCLDGQFRQSITRTRIEIAVLNGASRLDLLSEDAGEDACSTTTPRPTKTEQQRQVSGTWEGTYVCAQGETGLRLKLAAAKDGEVTATFTFYPVDTNPDVPEGSFTMRGRQTGATISLTQDRWIIQPPGYMMVDLTGTFDGNRLEGDVSAGCGRFAVQKTASAKQIDITGTWKGTYVCAQGETGLRLKLTGQKNGEVTATFTFYPIETNPGVPKGSFTMRGRYADTVISLTQERWINQPPGYMMVDLTGTFDGNRLEGSVSAGCGRFTVKRS